MKKVIKITSALSGLVAVISAVMGIKVLFGRSYGSTFILFSLVRNGTIMGFIGNLIAVAFTVFGFAVMCYSGLMFERSARMKKTAFIWGCVMSILCVISLICTLAGHKFNFGDIIILLLPVVYTLGIFKSA